MNTDPNPADEPVKDAGLETPEAASADEAAPEPESAAATADTPAEQPASMSVEDSSSAPKEPAAEEPVAEEPAVEEPAVAAPTAEADSDLPEVTLGQGAPADESVDPNYVPVLRGKVDRFGVAMGTGRRKTAVARVRIRQGSGRFEVNGRTLDEFFCVERDREMVQAPLRLVGQHGKVDVSVRVNGGGTTGQTGAIVLGVGRALQAHDPSLHHKLAESGFLTRDGRMVERKKYGLRKARRSFQFSKR